MTQRTKIGANDQCPCWSGRKYKKCCRGSVDWPAILATRDGHIRHMSVRGRNLLFADAIFNALKLDNDKIPNLASFKKAFTAEAVREIHEAVFELWPPDTELQYVLGKSSSTVSGLYIGDYETEFLERSVVRHCLYADRIHLVDPFPHPHVVAPKFNPLDEPAQHRAQTLKNVNRFLRFLPWIDAGLVEFVRTPDDFDRELAWETLKRAQDAGNDPELETALQETKNDLSKRHRSRQMKQLLLLGAPDSQLRRVFRENLGDESPIGEDEFIAYIHRERELDPDFLAPADGLGEGQLHTMTSGGTIEIAKATAEMTGAYLFTDLKVRWEMLQKDRESLAVASQAWSPFAKALQNAELSFLNNVDLPVALDLRAEGKLEGVRSVLRGAWKADLADEEYDEKNAILLADNLQQAIREAEAEWTSIQAGLANLGMAEMAGGLLAAGPLIAQGHAEWVAGAAVAATAGHSLAAHLKKRGFEKRYPASFFIDLIDKD